MVSTSVYLLPVLYSQVVSGQRSRQTVWKVWAQDGTVYKTHGAIHGKLRDPGEGRACSPKNAGRTNATTAQEQAVFCARRDWTKKLDKGYIPSHTDQEGQNLYALVMKAKASKGGTNHTSVSEIARYERAKKGLPPLPERQRQRATNRVVLDIGVVLPMHAHVFTFNPSCLKHVVVSSGIYIQPKFDGVRCVARLAEQKEAGLRPARPEEARPPKKTRAPVVLSSRTGKQFPWFDVLRREVYALLAPLSEPLILDGEIYAHRILSLDGGGSSTAERPLSRAERFSVITGAAGLKRSAPSPYEPQIEFHVFDVIDPSGALDQGARFSRLARVFAAGETLHVKKAETKLVTAKSEIEAFHERAVANEYEGVILRDQALVYEPNRRSLKLRKYKLFDTDEFRIVDASSGHGTENGAVVWVCAIGRQRFDCRPAAPLKKRREQFADYHKYVGCLLTVKYQGLSQKGIPRFPTGVGIRREFED